MTIISLLKLKEKKLLLKINKSKLLQINSMVRKKMENNNSKMQMHSRRLDKVKTQLKLYQPTNIK
jgi:hypothetical protein